MQTKPESELRVGVLAYQAAYREYLTHMMGCEPACEGVRAWIAEMQTKPSTKTRMRLLGLLPDWPKMKPGGKADALLSPPPPLPYILKLEKLLAGFAPPLSAGEILRKKMEKLRGKVLLDMQVDIARLNNKYRRLDPGNDFTGALVEAMNSSFLLWNSEEGGYRLYLSKLAKAAVMRQLRERRTVTAPARTYSERKKLRSAVDNLAVSLGRQPTDEEIVSSLGVQPRWLQRVRDSGTHFVSMDAEVGEDGDMRIGDTMADPAPSADPAENHDRSSLGKKLLAVLRQTTSASGAMLLLAGTEFRHYDTPVRGARVRAARDARQVLMRHSFEIMRAKWEDEVRKSALRQYEDLRKLGRLTEPWHLPAVLARLRRENPGQHPPDDTVRCMLMRNHCGVRDMTRVMVSATSARSMPDACAELARRAYLKLRQDWAVSRQATPALAAL